MSDEGVRFTAWLSETERDRLKELARQHGTSQNYIVRVAIRQLLGLPTVAQLTPTVEEDARAG